MRRGRIRGFVSAGAAFALVVTAVSGFAAANTVPGSLAGINERAQGAND